MTQKTRNLYNLGALFLLITITWIVFITGEDHDGNIARKKQFTLPLNTVIDRVILTSPEDTLDFEYRTQQWWVNGEYLMDIGMRDIFFGVLSGFELRRTMPRELRDSLNTIFDKQGVNVRIFNQEELLRNYIIAGNKESGLSFIRGIADNEIFEINIPGYRSFIAGLFYAPPEDWRSRQLFDFDWTNLTGVDITYPGDDNNNLSIRYGKGFFVVKGGQNADSAALLNYIQELSLLQAQRFIGDKERVDYQSLLLTRPVATIKVSAIGREEQHLEIFAKKENSRLQVVRLNKRDLALFSVNDLNKVLAGRQAMVGQ